MPQLKKTTNTDLFYSSDTKSVIKSLGKKVLLQDLWKMLFSRVFEARGESAYQQGKIGGFFHAYIGQEAVQAASVRAFGVKNWYISTYRCHMIALLLGADPKEVMAELYGKENGNVQGRGGSMHLYTDRLLGGFAIVGGHLPIAAGAAFSLKYQKIKDQVAICYLGDGALAQGAFHETMNLVSLWDLPCIFIIENNHWGMGTPVEKAISFKRLAKDPAPAYQMKAYTVDGMDYFNCFSCFSHVYKEVLKTGRPVLIEAITDRFRGHSISDPGLYRTKKELLKSMERDPIHLLRDTLIKEKMLTMEMYQNKEKETHTQVKEMMQFADDSSWPDPATLEEDVFA